MATYTGEWPGMSAHVLKDGIFSLDHTYSAYTGGLHVLWGMYPWADLRPPGVKMPETGVWWRRHDEYNKG